MNQEQIGLLLLTKLLLLAGFCYVAQAGLRLTTFLPQPTEYTGGYHFQLQILLTSLGTEDTEAQRTGSEYRFLHTWGTPNQ